MAKKSVGKEGAYKHKGMKAPKAKDYPGELDPSKPPQRQPKHAMRAEKKWQKPEEKRQSNPPSHKGKKLTSAEAPEGVSGVNGGSSMSLPKSGGVGESEV